MCLLPTPQHLVKLHRHQQQGVRSVTLLLRPPLGVEDVVGVAEALVPLPQDEVKDFLLTKSRLQHLHHHQQQEGFQSEGPCSLNSNPSNRL